ncbi:MAG TPA: hypothetical protein VD969_21545 [Symbiobacteriaceae bacterium]|nr:hypothetical protein [Symbiobacteriaceae bacterium]
MIKITPAWLPFLIALMGISPFPQGLYAPAYQLLVGMIIFGALGFFVLDSPRRSKWLIQPLDVAVLTLAGFYIMAFFWAVSPRAALQEAIKQCMYVSLYWMVSRSIQNNSDRLRFAKCFGWLVAAVGFGSLLLATGWVPVEGAVSFWRLAGPFTYPNALAAYLLIGLGLALGFRSSAARFVDGTLWSVCLYTVSLAALATHSRIGLAAAGLALLVSWLASPRGHRLSLVVGGIPALIATVAVTIPLDRTLEAGGSPLVLVWYLAGLVAVAALEGLALGVRKLALTPKVLWTIGALALVPAIAVAVMRAPQLISRFSSFSMSDQSLILRFVTYQDALRAWWTEGPVLGLGGGGWNAVFTKYQSLSFVSRLVHSSLLETMVEVGVQGALIFVAVWLLGIWSAWKLRSMPKTDEAQPVVWAGLIGGMAGLIAHSMMDVDWSYPAIALTAYAVFGVWRSAVSTYRPLAKGEARQSWVLPVAGSASVLLFLVSASLLTGAWYARNAEEALKRGDRATAQQQLRAATRFDPLNPSFQSMYGDNVLELAAASKNARMLPESERALARAIVLDPHNPDYQIMYANYAMLIGNHPLAFEALNQASLLDTKSADTYMRAIRHGLLNVKNSLKAGKMADAHSYLSQTKAIIDRFQQQEAAQPQHMADSLLLTRTPPLELQIAEYQALSGDLAGASDLLKKLTQAADAPVRAEAWLWLHLVEAERGHDQVARDAQAALKENDNTLVAQISVLKPLLHAAVTGQ